MENPTTYLIDQLSLIRDKIKTLKDIDKRDISKLNYKTIELCQKVYSLDLKNTEELIDLLNVIRDNFGLEDLNKIRLLKWNFNIIFIENEELEEEIRDFIGRSAEQIDFNDLLRILIHIEDYLVLNQDRFNKDDLKSLVLSFTDFYKKVYENRELEEKQIDILCICLNFLYGSIGYVPMKKDGEFFEVNTLKKWLDEDFKKYSELKQEIKIPRKSLKREERSESEEQLQELYRKETGKSKTKYRGKDTKDFAEWKRKYLGKAIPEKKQEKKKVAGKSKGKKQTKKSPSSQKLTKEQEKAINMSEEQVELYFFINPIEEKYKELIESLYYTKVYNPEYEKSKKYTGFEQYSGAMAYLKKPYTKIEMLFILNKWKEKDQRELKARWDELMTSEKYGYGAMAVLTPYLFLESIIIAELLFMKSGTQSPELIHYPEYKRNLSDITPKIKSEVQQEIMNFLLNLTKEFEKITGKEIELTEGEPIYQDFKSLPDSIKQIYRFQVYYSLKKKYIKLSKQDLEQFTIDLIEEIKPYLEKKIKLLSESKKATQKQTSSIAIMEYRFKSIFKIFNVKKNEDY